MTVARKSSGTRRQIAGRSDLEEDCATEPEDWKAERAKRRRTTTRTSEDDEMTRGVKRKRKKESTKKTRGREDKKAPQDTRRRSMMDDEKGEGGRGRRESLSQGGGWRWEKWRKEMAVVKGRARVAAFT